jgi:Tol biopolymer transport system component
MPFVDGLAAMQVDYSRDGHWIAYVRFPDHSIWRSAADGSEKSQLSDASLMALNPRWSRDATQITFSAARGEGGSSRIYIVPAGGGPVRQLTSGDNGSAADNDGNWSADGATIVFGAEFGDPSIEEKNRLVLETVDVKTQHIARLPGTEGLWSPRWSPDGSYILAMGFPNRLWLYRLKDHVRRQLTTIGAGWPSWSRDSQYVYFQSNPGTDWLRVRVQDSRVEHVASLRNLKLASASLGWVGLTPDGAPIATRDAGGTEIYKLDWE